MERKPIKSWIHFNFNIIESIRVHSILLSLAKVEFYVPQAF